MARPWRISRYITQPQRLCSHFSASVGGNIAIIAAFCAVPVFALLAGSVDLIRWMTATEQLEAALDAGALAAASVSNRKDMEETAKDYIMANLPDRAPWRNFTRDDINISDVVDDDGIKQLSISATVPMDTLFLPLLKVDKLDIGAETRAQQEWRSVEIALAVDISSSMARRRKIQNLREAAGEFVQTMLAGEGRDITSISLIPFGGHVNFGDHFDQFAVSGSQAYFDPGPASYSIGSEIPNSSFRFSDSERCIELRREDFGDDLLPSEARAQVPFFWFWTTDRGWCPTEKTAVVLNSNDIGTLINRIDEMELSDGTGIDVGAAYAAKALSPKWRGHLGGDFPERPDDYASEDTIKFMILMTDGNITNQFRPVNFQIPDTSVRGNMQEVNSKDDAISQLLDLCRLLAGNEVHVFTIGFDTGTGAELLMRQCASEPRNFFKAEVGELQEVFREIAASISDLRVSK